MLSISNKSKVVANIINSTTICKLSDVAMKVAANQLNFNKCLTP